MSTAPVFNIQNAQNAIIGMQQNATLNIVETFDGLNKIIETKSLQDQAELSEVMVELKKIVESGKSVEKGRLARFADILGKFTDIATAVGKILLDFFIKK